MGEVWRVFCILEKKYHAIKKFQGTMMQFLNILQGYLLSPVYRWGWNNGSCWAVIMCQLYQTDMQTQVFDTLHSSDPRI